MTKQQKIDLLTLAFYDGFCVYIRENGTAHEVICVNDDWVLLVSNRQKNLFQKVVYAEIKPEHLTLDRGKKIKYDPQERWQYYVLFLEDNGRKQTAEDIYKEIHYAFANNLPIVTNKWIKKKELKQIVDYDENTVVVRPNTLKGGYTTYKLGDLTYVKSAFKPALISSLVAKRHYKILQSSSPINKLLAAVDNYVNLQKNDKLTQAWFSVLDALEIRW